MGPMYMAIVQVNLVKNFNLYFIRGPVTILKWNSEWRLVKGQDDSVLFKDTDHYFHLGGEIIWIVYNYFQVARDSDNYMDGLLGSANGLDLGRAAMETLLGNLVLRGVIRKLALIPKVLLVNSMNYEKNGCNNYDSLARLASILVQQGIPTEVFDCSFEQDDEPYYSQLKRFHYDVIGFSCYTPGLAKTIQRMHLAKVLQPEVRIVLGGVHATQCYNEILDHHKMVDAVVLGEAETTIVKIIKFVHGLIPDDGVAGLAWEASGERLIRPSVSDCCLDAIPMPSLGHIANLPERLELEFYRIKTSRGCASKCSFCAVNSLGRKLRYASIDKIMEEMLWAEQNLRFNAFQICDDNFILNLKRVGEFCEKMIKLFPDKKWLCNAKLEDLTDEVITMLQRGGCSGLLVGLESLNEPTLKAVGKNIKKGAISTEETFRRLDKCLRANMILNISLIVGLPGETKEDILNTYDKILKYIEKAPELKKMVIISTPIIALFPGTELRENAENYGYRWIDRREDSLLCKPTVLNSSLTSDETIELATFFARELRVK